MPSEIARRAARAVPIAAALATVLAAPAAAEPMNVSAMSLLSPQGAATPLRTASTNSYSPAISLSGARVAFPSNARDLSPDHPVGTTQIYVRTSGTLTIGSRASKVGTVVGAPSITSSAEPALSADGRYLAFTSAANNLSDDDLDGTIDVFRRDLTTGLTKLVSRTTGNVAGTGGATGTSSAPAMSQDGRFVAFASNANNLATTDADGNYDVFVRDMQANTTQLVSVGLSGLPALGDSVNPSISSSGGTVAFQSNSPNLVLGDVPLTTDIYVRNRPSAVTTLVSRATGVSGAAGIGSSFNPSISAAGSKVVFESDVNLTPEGSLFGRDIYLRNRSTNTTTLLSRADGPTGAAGNGNSITPTISPDGTYVAYSSVATNLSAQDLDGGVADVFVRGLVENNTTLASRAVSGVAANASSTEPTIATLGGTVIFQSRATNLIPTSPGLGGNIYSAALRSPLAIVATSPPETSTYLSKFATNVTCNIKCTAIATGSVTLTTVNGTLVKRNAAGYGIQSLTAGVPRKLSVYLIPTTQTFLRRELEKGGTATVTLTVTAYGDRGEKATALSTGPLLLPPPTVPAA